MLGLILEYANSIDLFNTIFTLKTNTLRQLKLTHSLRTSSTLSHFCKMLKKNKTLVELDLFHLTGVADEAFIMNLLDILRGHNSIKYLSLHVQDIQPSNRKETHLIQSLRNYEFISRLCISASVISHELIEALIHASKERNTLTHLEFYNGQMTENDMAQLQSLYNDGNLIQLTFSEKSRWDVMLEETNGPLSNGKNCKKSNFVRRNEDDSWMPVMLDTLDIHF